MLLDKRVAFANLLLKVARNAGNYFKKNLKPLESQPGRKEWQPQ